MVVCVVRVKHHQYSFFIAAMRLHFFSYIRCNTGSLYHIYTLKHRVTLDFRAIMFPDVYINAKD